jgi:Zn-dependent peptidase ImmA (M78 family)
MSRGISGFQAPRLAQALDARRLSQAQLSAMVGVSPATVSKWRSGAQAPEHETLERLATVLNLSTEWFTRPVLPESSVPLFRSNASAHVAARAMLRARLMWVQDVAMQFSEFVDFPDLRLPQRSYTEPEQITRQDIEQAAAECREMWRLGRGPIPDLALAVEGAGVILAREETGVAQIEGLSAWSAPLGRPIVLLAADKANGYRSRFDLAHEIGHVVAHKHIDRVTDRERHKLLEKQAHCFAGALLMPAESFAQEVCVPVSLDDLLLLKRRWGVSVGAIIMRLHMLGMVDEDQYTTLMKRRSARWGNKAEPGDADRPPERPRLFRRTADLLVESGVLPLDGIPRHLGLSEFDAEALLGLPAGYFRGSANVVQLAKLRTPGESSSPMPSPPGDGKVLPFRRA